MGVSGIVSIAGVDVKEVDGAGADDSVAGDVIVASSFACSAWSYANLFCELSRQSLAVDKAFSTFCECVLCGPA